MLRPAASLGDVAVVGCDPDGGVETAGLAPSSPEITGQLRPATSGPGGSCTHDDLRTFAGATTPARSARADPLLRAHGSRPPGGACRATTASNRAGAAAARRPSRRRLTYPHVGLDQRVARDESGRDSVSAVPDVQDRGRHAPGAPAAPHGPPRATTRYMLDLRPVEAAAPEANVCQRDPCRCERRSMWIHLLSARGRVECGRVESNHHSAGQRDYSALSSPVLGVRRNISRPSVPALPGAVAGRSRAGICPAEAGDPGPPSLAETEQLRRRSRRLQGSASPKAACDRGSFRPCGTPPLRKGTGRPVGLEPTQRGSRPRMLAVTSRPPGEKWKAGSAPRNRRQRRYRLDGSRSQLLPIGAPASACLRRHLLTGRPWRLVEASCTLGPALCPALVPSLPRPARRRVVPVDGAGGIRTHGLELTRLARTAAPLPRAALERARVWSAGFEPAISDARSRWGGHLPYDQS